MAKYNLKKTGGTFKGAIAEFMFKITRKNAFITRFYSCRWFLNKFRGFLNTQQADFLIKNWYSLDSIEINFSNRNIMLYEIKTQNQYSKRMGYKPMITQSAINIYSRAQDLGFQVVLAMVNFLDDWDFSIEILEFSKSNFCVDKPKRWDKKE